MRIRFAAALWTALVTGSIIGLAQGDTKKVDAAVQRALASLAQCSADNPRTPCNVFVCDAVRVAYGADVAAEFVPSGQCLLADQLHARLMAIAGGTQQPKNPVNQWTLIGSAAEPSVLARGQACTNEGFLTIAASSSKATGGTNGHVVLIVPGRLERSTAWGTEVPQVAGQRLDSVGKPIEKANSNQTRMSEHWGNDKRAHVDIFVFGQHRPKPNSSGCN